MVDGVVALHATDPATVMLSTWARYPSVTVGDVDAALYDGRSLVRIHGMRRTLWVVPTSLAPVVETAVNTEVALRERRRLLKLVDEHVEGDVDKWYERARSGVLAVLRERGVAFGDELREAVPELGLRFPYGGGMYTVGSRVLFQLAVEGDLIRTNPRGSWRSNVYAWQLREEWAPLGEDLPSMEHARATLVDRWLVSFGPGTLEDITWWTGWGKRATRQALRDAHAVSVSLDEGDQAFLAAGDDQPVESEQPWVALLPALDPTTMGWKQRGWYLGSHAADLFDRNGNAGPTIWASGRVVGGWAQGSDGAIATAFLEAVDDNTRDLVGELSALLRHWLGDHVVVPRFRTPLEQELTRR